MRLMKNLGVLCVLVKSLTLLQKGYLDRKDAKSAKILEQERENLYPYAPFCTKYSTIP